MKPEMVAHLQGVTVSSHLVEEELVAGSIAVWDVGSRVSHCNCPVNGKGQDWELTMLDIQL